MITAVLAIIFGLIGVNVLSAGMAAIFCLWRRKWARATRVLVAIGATGLLPPLVLSGAFIEQAAFGEGVAMAFGIASLVVVTGVLSLPGALLLSAKIEQPPDYGDTFR